MSGFRFDYSKGGSGEQLSKRLRYAYANAPSIENDESEVKFETPQVLLNFATMKVVLHFKHDDKVFSCNIDAKWFKKAERDFKLFSAILGAAGVKNEQRNARALVISYPLMGNDEKAVPWGDLVK